MNRRTLLKGAGAWVALVPGRLRAQSRPTLPRVAFLHPSTPEFSKPQQDAFAARLKELGYQEGRNVLIDRRWANGSWERLPALARELLALNPAVIVAPANQAAAAVRQETSTVPIVFLAVDAPDRLGFVASLGRPGGNMTGTSFRGPAMSAKLRELIREVFPHGRRVAVLIGDDPATQKVLPAARVNFAQAGLEVEFFVVKGHDYAAAFARIVQWRPDILWPAPTPQFVSVARELAAFAAVNRLPMVGTRRAYADTGGLLTYDNDLREDYRRAAGYVDRILKGANPGDLPVEQPDRFQLVVNLRTAKSLGITIPPPVLLRADEVIE